MVPAPPGAMEPMTAPVMLLVVLLAKVASYVIPVLKDGVFTTGALSAVATEMSAAVAAIFEKERIFW